MTYIIGQEKPTLDDLSHHGIKGMKWGHHKAQPSGGGGGGGSAAPSNRELNKASRMADKTKRKADNAEFNKNFDGEIDKARANLGNHRQQLKDAKTKFKAEKQTIGSREARKNLNEVRSQVAIEREVAQFAKSGKETRNAVLLAAGGIAISTIIKVAASSR